MCHYVFLQFQIFIIWKLIDCELRFVPHIHLSLSIPFGLICYVSVIFFLFHCFVYINADITRPFISISIWLLIFTITIVHYSFFYMSYSNYTAVTRAESRPCLFYCSILSHRKIFMKIKQQHKNYNIQLDIQHHSGRYTSFWSGCRLLICSPSACLFVFHPCQLSQCNRHVTLICEWCFIIKNK